MQSHSDLKVNDQVVILYQPWYQYQLKIKARTVFDNSTRLTEAEAFWLVAKPFIKKLDGEMAILVADTKRLTIPINCLVKI